MLQSPSLSQSVHPALFPFDPQQLLPRQTPEEHCEPEVQDPPSDFFEITHWYELSVYPEVHLSQRPDESQLVHLDAWHVEPAHRLSLQTPEEHCEPEVQDPPFGFDLEPQRSLSFLEFVRHTSGGLQIYSLTLTKL